MKKWIVLVMVAALVLAAAPLAMAGHGHGKGHGKGQGKSVGKARGKAKFQLVGTIVAVDAGGETLTVTIKACTKSVKGLPGPDVDVLVPSTAKVRMLVDGEAVQTVALADLAGREGAKVKIGGTLTGAGEDRQLTATKVLAHEAPVAVVAPEETPLPTVTPAAE